jgi:nucleotide-binding universal stress UspA family protein
VKQVVVGVSPTSGSPNALRCAAEEARWRGAELVAVQAWRPPRPPAAPGGRPPAVTRDVEGDLRAAEMRLHDQVAQALGSTTDATCRIVHGGAGEALLEESAEAELLVIDAPRRIALTGSPLLAHKLVYNATCPILVMPRPAA